MQLSNLVFKFVHRLLDGLGEVTDDGIGWAGRALTPVGPDTFSPSCRVSVSGWLSRAAKPSAPQQERP
ncbi:MAG: hypothetical protein H7Z12_18470 [Rhodospirillaceae bacterium]|nr:hypothetical protein [Rhodospirillales bacterium]